MQSYFNRAAHLSRGGWVLGVAVLGFVFVNALAPALSARQEKTVKEGVFTEAQAKRGEGLYQEQCAPCHGSDLSGGAGPALAGADFLSFWDKMPLSDLVEKIQTSMPANSPGTLDRKQSADVVGYILQMGKFPAGQTDLSDDAAVLKTIVIAK